MGIQNSPASVCTTGRYNQNAANEPCTSSPCKKADAATCCTGSPNNGGNNGGNSGGGGSSSCSPNSCYGLTTFSSSGQSCGMAAKEGVSSVIPNGQCNRMPGSAAYYQMSCNGNGVLGKFGCDTAICNNCALNNFQINANEVGQCVSKSIDCLPGRAGSCLTKDVWINRQCVADGASSWAVSAFAAAVVMANVA